MWINQPTAGGELVNAVEGALISAARHLPRSLSGQNNPEGKAPPDQSQLLQRQQHLYSIARLVAERYGLAQATEKGDIEQVLYLPEPQWVIKVEGTRVSIEDVLGQKLYVASDKEVIEDNLWPQELAIFQELGLHMAEEIALGNGAEAQAALARTYQQMGIKPQQAQEAARIRTQVDGFRSRTLEENLLMQEVQRNAGLLEPDTFNASVGAIRTLDTAKALVEAYGEGEARNPSGRQYEVGLFNLQYWSGQEHGNERVLITHAQRGPIAELSNGQLQSLLTPTDVAEFERTRAQLVQALSLEWNQSRQSKTHTQPQRVTEIER